MFSNPKSNNSKESDTDVTFEQAVAVVIFHEGDYVFDRNDPGGETKYGISKRAYPNIDIRALTVDKAKQIYKSDYWDRLHCDKLPTLLRLMVFDCAVNQGVARASLFLQRSLGVTGDGVLGPITFQALNGVNPLQVLIDYAKLRHDAYTKNPTWRYYGAGWSKRLLDTFARCIAFEFKI